MGVRLKYLTLEERKVMSRMYRHGARAAQIAAFLGVHPSTVYRELKRGLTGELDENQRRVYDPQMAQEALRQSLKRRGARA